MFASDLSAANDFLLSNAQEVGLDIPTWQQALLSEETFKQVLADVQLGYEVNVVGTPTVFLNGKFVEEFQLPVLEFLINNELKALDQ